MAEMLALRSWRYDPAIVRPSNVSVVDRLKLGLVALEFSIAANVDVEMKQDDRLRNNFLGEPGLMVSIAARNR